MSKAFVGAVKNIKAYKKYGDRINMRENMQKEGLLETLHENSRRKSHEKLHGRLFKVSFKRAVCIGCVAALSMGTLTGCGSKTDGGTSGSTATKSDAATQTMSVEGYEIAEDELMVYTLLKLLAGEYAYADLAADPETYKTDALQYAVETKILYDVAVSEGIEFSDSDIETREKLAKSFISYFPDEVFETYGITEDTVQRVFVETTMVEKLDNDKRNELGQELTDEYSENLKDYNFQNLYYMIFPTVEADENNEPVVDDDGNYISLSDEECAEVKENAETVAKAINDGGDAEALAEEYGVDVYSSETSGYVGAYSDELNEVLGSLSAGQCTEVYESSTGYCLIAVLTDHDSDLLTSYAYTMASNVVDDKYENMRNEWLVNMATPTDADLVGTFWLDFSILDMATDLYQRGLMS